MSEKSKPTTIVRAVEAKQPSRLMDTPQSALWTLPPKLAGAYLSFVPLMEYAARAQLATPILNKIMYPVLWGFSGFDTSFSGVEGNGRHVIVLALFYATSVWITTAIASSMGQGMGGPDGYQNQSPRLKKASLTGFPHRLVALHENLLDSFPLFAITAVFTQMLAPEDPHLIELLSIHVLSKTTLYVTSYATDIDLARSLSHLVSVGSCVRALSIMALKV